MENYKVYCDGILTQCCQIVFTIAIQYNTTLITNQTNTVVFKQFIRPNAYDTIGGIESFDPPEGFPLFAQLTNVSITKNKIAK